MNYDEIKKLMDEIKNDPNSLKNLDSDMMSTLKEIITIERRYLYGMDSTSASKRKEAIQNLIENKLRKKN